jgi:hypothetical protein
VHSVGAIEKLYAGYKDKAHLFVVYIREAHPDMPKNKFNISQPKSLEERQKVAAEFAATLKLSLPILVDTIDDQVNKVYAAWPDRVYVIDAEGKIALKGGIGPGGFTPAVKATPGTLDKLLSGPSGR